MSSAGPDPERMQQVLLELSTAAEELAAAKARRDRAIVEAVNAGVPSRTIGKHARLSHARVQQIAKEAGERG